MQLPDWVFDQLESGMVCGWTLGERDLDEELETLLTRPPERFIMVS